MQKYRDEGDLQCHLLNTRDMDAGRANRSTWISILATNRHVLSLPPRSYRLMKHWTEVLLEKLRNPRSVKNFAVYFLIACAGVTSNVFCATYIRRAGWVGYGSSIVLGYLFGMVVGFVLTKFFAFNARNSGNAMREAVKFLMVSLVALTVTWVFSEIILRIVNFFFNAYPNMQEHLEALVGDVTFMVDDLTGLPIRLRFIDRQLFSHLGGICFGFFANFFGHKYFTFKTTGLHQKYISRKREAGSVG